VLSQHLGGTQTLHWTTYNCSRIAGTLGGYLSSLLFLCLHIYLLVILSKFSFKMMLTVFTHSPSLLNFDVLLEEPVCCELILMVSIICSATLHWAEDDADGVGHYWASVVGNRLVLLQ
jgi:hypothetical protein